MAKIARTITEGLGLATQRLYGVSETGQIAILEEFAALSDDGRAAFAHAWVAKTAHRLERTWPVFYRLLKIIEEKQIYRNALILGYGKDQGISYQNFAEYFEAVVKRPFAEWAELEDTYHYVARFAPDLFQRSYSEAKGVRVQGRMRLANEQTTGKVLPEGGDQKSEERKSLLKLSSDSQAHRAEQFGISRSSQQKLDRLARDFPDLFNQVKQGKLSIDRAGKEAGFVKTLTPLDKLTREWKKASETERSLFADIVTQWKDEHKMN
jgi:hypothetical protein